jgi:hypothetical protein
MFWHLSHRVIYPAEQFDDKVFGCHGTCLQQLATIGCMSFVTFSN